MLFFGVPRFSIKNANPFSSIFYGLLQPLVTRLESGSLLRHLRPFLFADLLVHLLCPQKARDPFHLHAGDSLVNPGAGHEARALPGGPSVVTEGYRRWPWLPPTLGTKTGGPPGH